MVCLVTRPLSLSECAVINCLTELGDVTQTNRTQAPKQHTAGNQISRAGTIDTRTWSSSVSSYALVTIDKIINNHLFSVDNVGRGRPYSRAKGSC